MRKALVAIGVDGPTSGFPRLQAAADGAKQIAAWGAQQGFDVSVLTDDGGNLVTLAAVFAAVQKFVDAKVYSQLVVYFSGHGILLSPDTEAWLLSGALANPNEAINVSGSIVAARTSGIAHIVFVSDACRSMPAQFRMGMVAPGLIFPANQPRPPLPEIDVFYATLPGDPALEVGPTDAEKSFRGLLTSCMLKALQGMPTTLVEQLVDGPVTRKVVASRPLKGYLVQAVPDAAAAISIKLLQSPDVRVESALPKYLADLTSGGVGAPAPSPTPAPAPNAPVTAPASRVAQPGAVELEAAAVIALEAIAPKLIQSWKLAINNPSLDLTAHLPAAVGADIKGSVEQILGSAGRASFETRTGFTVHGAEVRSVRVTQTDQACDIWPEGGATQVRVYADFDQRRPPVKRLALMRFSDGTGIGLSVLPGFIGSVVVESGHVRTVNYAPSKHTPWHDEYAYFAREIEERKALVAVAARHGSFRLDKEAARETARYLRRHKLFDPTLGLYAAYAYAQAGDNGGVLSVYAYMQDDPAPTLFDVAMLAAQRSTEVPQDLDYAPWLPVLTQGWMLLGKFEREMPDVLQQARRFLLPGLWTTFASEGMDILEARVLGR